MQRFHDKIRHHQPLDTDTIYANNPIENSPKGMSLDGNLKEDLHEDVNWLYSITNCLDEFNPVKFLKTTVT